MRPVAGVDKQMPDAVSAARIINANGQLFDGVFDECAPVKSAQAAGFPHFHCRSRNRLMLAVQK